MSKDIIIKGWESFVNNATDEHNVTITIKFPFCISKCKFCKYRTKNINSKSDIMEWLDKLEIDVLEYKSVFKNYVISNLYIAGGTPTIMNSNEFIRLMEIINNNFNIDYSNDTTFRIEGSLETLDDNMIKLYKEYNVNRLALGVQSLSNNILSGENRINNNDSLDYKLDKLRQLNKIFMLSVDLIDGLDNYDTKKVVEDFNILEKIVDIIFVYKLINVPYTYANDFHKFNKGNLEEYLKPFNTSNMNYILLGDDIKFVKKGLKCKKSFVPSSKIYPSSVIGFGYHAKSWNHYSKMRYENLDGHYEYIENYEIKNIINNDILRYY